ncbi:ABC-type sugar transport system ATPase subunit [Sinorhizobium fredii]
MGQLNLNKVQKFYGTYEVLKSIELQVKNGEFVVFVGPSGCGKSTLLRMIAGLDETTAGDIVIDGKRVNDLPPVKRGIAMVFQSYALYPHMTVFENIAFPLRVEKMPEEKLKAKVEQAARILHLDQRLQQKPGMLSGGQRQRVAIGRAIVREPKIFLFDEPLSNLDAALRADMRIELAKLHRQLKATMIYVTHDQVEAMTMADRIVVLNAGEIAQTGAPLELYHKPANIFVAGFIGNPKMNFLPVTCTGASEAGVEIDYRGQAALVPVTPAQRHGRPYADARRAPGAYPDRLGRPDAHRQSFGHRAPRSTHGCLCLARRRGRELLRHAAWNRGHPAGTTGENRHPRRRLPPVRRKRHRLRAPGRDDRHRSCAVRSGGGLSVYKQAKEAAIAHSPAAAVLEWKCVLCQAGLRGDDG